MVSLLYRNMINNLALKHKVLPEKKVDTIHNGVHDIGTVSKYNQYR